MSVVDDHRCRRFCDCIKNHFDEFELKVASIMLNLSYPVVFSYNETLSFSVGWGATKLRTSFLRQQPPEVHPSSLARKSLPVKKVRSSPSSCLSGDVEKTPPKSMKEDLGEFSSKYEILNRSSTQRNIFPVLDNLQADREGFFTPVMQQAFSERQRVFKEARQRRIAILRSKRLKLLPRE